ncbi:MAG: methyltransferase domain-containing protein [Pontiellaceae bacterium]|nr:methyltransferase domain-containing protein [Pontiellaceae bacterium]MBN2785139.1 methyltransferase domain-containing protein [Pontiellaceae bacterium]
MECHHCRNELKHVFLDLGEAPPSNSYLLEDEVGGAEKCYPLKLYVCETCWLVQTEDTASGDDLFPEDYAYFSSVSTSWLDHARRYVDMITERLGLGADSFVLEIASNDGYLLRNFVARGIPCLGIEPTTCTAEVAKGLGIPVICEFFGSDFAAGLVSNGQQADLIIGNNVYAHVPDINDFTEGLKKALKSGGTITLEFPHLMTLLEYSQFDTVYHEHYSYLSLYTVSLIFQRVGLRVCDVEKLPTHGGSLRVYGCHADDPRPDSERVASILDEEVSAGMKEMGTYLDFQPRVDQIRDDLLVFLTEQKKAGRSVAAYGAAAKGNTLLNYAGVKSDLISFVCDAAPSKQGKYMPGSHIPIVAPAVLKERKPDFVIILPWNITHEIIGQETCVCEWGGRFVVAIPSLNILGAAV